VVDLQVPSAFFAPRAYPRLPAADTTAGATARPIEMKDETRIVILGVQGVNEGGIGRVEERLNGVEPPPVNSKDCVRSAVEVTGLKRVTDS
jgi:hypothetical protein